MASYWLVLVWCERKILLVGWRNSQQNRVLVLEIHRHHQVHMVIEAEILGRRLFNLSVVNELVMLKKIKKNQSLMVKTQNELPAYQLCFLST